MHSMCHHAEIDQQCTVVSRYIEPIGALDNRSVYPEVRYREYNCVKNMNSVTR